jgi:hypothetical protein
MDALFTTPLGGAGVREIGRSMVERRARMTAELPELAMACAAHQAA